jgi:hypothetical protein
MLESVHTIEAGKALALCRHVEERARQSGHAAIRLHALGLAAERAAACGDRTGAGALAAETLSLARQISPIGVSVPDLMLCAHRSFAAAGDLDGAREALRLGVQFIETAALPNIPAEFRESFLHRNPTHRALLTAATRRN